MAAVRFRQSLLQEIAQCLMRLVEARSAAGGFDALHGLFQGLPCAWYAVDLIGDGRPPKRVLSHRCPRGLVPFVTRFGFPKRQDGTYQGTFAESTLLLVKVGAASPSDRCLVAAMGLARNSPLNDGVVSACVGALIHEALSRALWFDAHARRSAVLDSFVARDDEVVAVFDSRGALVERYPADGAAAIPPGLFERAGRDRRRGRSVQSVESNDGRSYRAEARWIAGERPLEEHYCLVHARARSAAAPAIAERLQTYGLSKREAQVAELVFTGKTNQGIADALFISRDTVKSHCKHIFGKLGISRRTEFLRVMNQA